jgi:diaminohydroxyphosphoribosylaminopyrimidine deaminase/5-amino-6-(5-phosphoribosylamino)uracil reductase
VGWHERDGGPHAERAALAALGRPPGAEATLYVTLEPCSTAGRTGACTEAIIASGLKRVVVGAVDPNPEHAGRGFERLRAAGIEVVTGLLGAECADLNLMFNHWIVRGTPCLAGKLAATLDGRTATRAGESRWITGEAARADVHRWRRLFPAIAVGAETVLQDDPRLTARTQGEAEVCPVRLVFDGGLRTVAADPLPGLYTDEFRARTVVVTTGHAPEGARRRLRDLGVEAWVCDAPTRRVPWGEFRQRCAERRLSGVYVEGGATVLGDLARERQLDYVFLYQAPVILGDDQARPMLAGSAAARLADGLRLGGVRREILGEDALTRGRVEYPKPRSSDAPVPGVG